MEGGKWRGVWMGPLGWKCNCVHDKPFSTFRSSRTYYHKKCNTYRPLRK